MIVSNFTVPELNYLRDNCNFVGYERIVFDLRSEGISIEEIADRLNFTPDGIKKISRKINSKINRVL